MVAVILSAFNERGVIGRAVESAIEFSEKREVADEVADMESGLAA